MLLYLFCFVLFTIISLILFICSYQLYQIRKVYNVNTGNYLHGFGIDFNYYLLTLKHPLPIFIHRKLKNFKEDLYYTFFGSDFKVMIKDHKLASQILFDPDTYVKAAAYRENKLLNRILGTQNVVFVNGEIWNRQRRSINPAFFNLEKYMNAINEKSNKILNKIEESEDGIIGNISDYMQKMTLDVLGRTIFDFEFNSIDGSIQRELTAYRYLMNNGFTLKTFLFGSIIYDYFSWTNFVIKFKENLEIFEDLIKRLVEKSKIKIKNGASQNEWCLLDYLVQSNMCEEISDEELKQNIIIFYLAGHETTSVALSYAILLLSMNKHIQDKLRNEVKSIIKEYGFNYESINKMEYLLCFIKETMRKYPPVSIIPDKLNIRDVILSNYYIPKGTLIGINVYSIHHSKEIYGDPENFRPERWTKEEQMKRKIPNSAWIPFSSGPRICIGNYFSLLEQKIFLTELLLNYQVISLEKNDLEQEKNFGISPPKPSKIQFKKIQGI